MKYIVEFEDEPCMYEDEVHFYKCIQAPWWGLSERVIKQLTPYQPDAPDTNVGNITNSRAHENDVIFRKAAIDAVVDEFKRSPTPAIRAKLRLEALPPAQPEQRWIPSGERPPEEGSYLVWMPFAPPEERLEKQEAVKLSGTSVTIAASRCTQKIDTVAGAEGD